MTAPIVIVCPAMPSTDFRRLAECIREVERRPRHPRGLHGELGDFQFKKSAWDEDAQGLPFSFALDRPHAEIVAERRLRRMSRLLTERCIDPTAYNLALCWNEGVSGVILGKWQTQGVRDYAVHVENLYLAR